MENLQKDFELKVFFRAGFLLTITSIAVGVLGYLFQVFVGRMLEPANFSVFSALLSLYALLGSPFSALNMLITKHVSILRITNHVHGVKYYWRLQKWAVIVCLIITYVFYFFSDFFIEHMRLESLNQLFIFSTLIIFSSLLVINNSFLQGLHFFGWQAISNVFSASMKLLFSFELINLGLGVNGAILGISLSAAFAWGIGTLVLVKILSKSKIEPDITFNQTLEVSRGLFQVLSICVSFALMTQLDMLLVNYFFSPSEAGEYAAASVLGKAVLYIPSGLIVALYPMTVDAHVKKLHGSLLLNAALSSTFFICGSLALVYFIWGNEIIHFIYGETYQGAGSILRWYGFTMLPMTLVVVYEHYLIAKGKIIFSWIFLVLGPLQVASIYLWHDQILYVLAAVACSGLLLFLGGSFVSYRYFKYDQTN